MLLKSKKAKERLKDAERRLDNALRENQKNYVILRKVLDDANNGKDGINGKNGRDGRDGRNGRDGRDLSGEKATA